MGMTLQEWIGARALQLTTVDAYTYSLVNAAAAVVDVVVALRVLLAVCV
jgi:phage major head subunit gpT-like protein